MSECRASSMGVVRKKATAHVGDARGFKIRRWSNEAELRTCNATSCSAMESAGLWRRIDGNRHPTRVHGQLKQNAGLEAKPAIRRTSPRPMKRFPRSAVAFHGCCLQYAWHSRRRNLRAQESAR